MNTIKTRNRVTLWYFSFFVVFIFIFATLLFFYLRHQRQETFDLKVSRFSSEMAEEILLYRSELKIDQQDPISWTEGRLEDFRSRVQNEITDEMIDIGLDGPGYVRIQDLIPGRILFQSQGVEEGKVRFVEDIGEPIGFQPVEYKAGGEKRIGVGYWGRRGVDIQYFIGVIMEEPADDTLWYKKNQPVLQLITSSVSRKGDWLKLDNGEKITSLLDENHLWAYTYQFEKDTVFWSSKEKDLSEYFFPEISFNKDFYCHIKEVSGKNLRQYTEINDRNANYIYRIDVAFPVRDVNRASIFYALFTYGTAFLLVIVLWIGGRILTSRALGTVDHVIHAVQEITSKNLDRRLPVPVMNNEIKELIATFNDLLERLSQAFKMQKSFIADASHELRTPLSILMGEIESARKMLDSNPEASVHLQEAISEIEHMARIVEDLRLLAYSDSGQISMNTKTIRLDDVLMNTLSRCQVLAAENHIQLSIGKMDIVEYRGDEELLIRALSNLVSNAIKFSMPDGEVKVSLYQVDHRVNFEVKDSGAGISTEEIPKIFERFYRADRSRSRTTGGSGLGLSIAKWIVELHSGRIHVESEIEKGSTFTIQLPVTG